MKDRTLERYQQILREDFGAFVGRTFRELNAADDFSFNWHIEVIASKLEQVRRGEIRRLIINVPPRQGKSIIGSVAFPAFVLGHNPKAKILCISYGQNLAEELADHSRNLMLTDFYQSLFETRLSQTRQSLDDYKTVAGGYRRSTSITGGITGRGGDIIIIDDPIKPDDALSDVKRLATNMSFYNTIYSRLNNKEKGAIVIIMQRVHMDDFVGFVTQREPWDVVTLPIIAERDEEYSIPTPYGMRNIVRKAGEVLHPERESPSTIEDLRASMTSFAFSAQFQQNPQPLEGYIVKAEWLRYYNAADLPSGGTLLQSWDTANKDTDTSNFSVCTIWRVVDRHFYLLHVLRERLNFPDLKRKAIELAQGRRADVVLVEDMASGTQLIQELREAGIAVSPAPPSSDSKTVRLINQTAKIESGFVHLPRHAPWLEGFVGEITAFPAARYDDQVDSMVHALAWDTQQMNVPNAGLLQYYEQEAAKLASGWDDNAPAKRRFKSLSTGMFQMLTRNLNVSKDEIIELTEEEAIPLLRSGTVIPIN